MAADAGADAAPAVRWPPERCRIVAPADHAEPELVNDATDAQVADYVALSGSADQRLQKLARAGLVRRAGREWQADFARSHDRLGGPTDRDVWYDDTRADT